MTSPAPVIFAEPDRPFWGFGEVFATVGVFLASLFLIVIALRPWLGADVQRGSWTVVEEAVAYALAFGALKVLFSRYDQPLLASLGWKRSPFPAQGLAITGFLLAGVVVLLEFALQTPEVHTPFEKLLSDPVSRVTIAIFGVSAAPVVEELLFRGFLQPLLVSSLGVLPGILTTASIFGAMHLAQNAALWQSFVLITVVGFVLGVVRHISGSTKASAIVHIAYNTLPFFALLVQSPPKPS